MTAEKFTGLGDGTWWIDEVAPLAPLTLGTSASTISEAQATAMTMAELDKMIDTLCGMPPEPIGEWMRQQGCPPEQWKLVLPSSMRPADWPYGLGPDYVVWVRWLQAPLFLRR